MEYILLGRHCYCVVLDYIIYIPYLYSLKVVSLNNKISKVTRVARAEAEEFILGSYLLRLYTTL